MITDDWQKYLDGQRYNQSLVPNYYDVVNTNIDFFDGNQYKGIETYNAPKPVFNIIKRATRFFVASITSSKTSIKLELMEDTQNEDNPAKTANVEIDNLLEKFKMDNRIRDALLKAAQMGDCAAHIYFDMRKKPYGGQYGDIKGEIVFELVNGTNVYFGNPNNPSTDKNIQPYIIISGRDTVENLRAEAKRNKRNQTEVDSINTDRNTQYQAGEMAQIEIDSDEYGKAEYIITYRYDPKTDTIKASKCTETAYMYEDVDTGLSEYPIAWLNWDKQESQYHGRALCTDIIPNQIFINRMFAMVMYHLMMAAFPKIIYNADKIDSISNMIAAQIGIKGVAPNDNITNYINQLEPGNMSNQIVQVIDMAIRYTKEMIGINDSTLGNVNPEQASGTAIATTVRQSSIPIENTKTNLYEWVEDIGRILVDMMGTYYETRPIIITRDGVKTIKQYDFSVLKNLWLNVKCDVGPSTYWSEIGMVQMLDNLLNRNDPLFGMIDYLESQPETYRNQDLIDRLKAKLQAQIDEQDKQQKMQQMAVFLKSQPPQIQQQIMNLPTDEAKYEAVQRLMGG